MLLACALGCGAASAQQDAAQMLELSTVVEKVTAVEQPDGTTRAELVGASVVTSFRGDELVYTLSFRNTSGTAVDNVRITTPIPLEVRYLADTAIGPGCEALFSVDGGRTFGQPGELYVGLDDERRVAVADDYTHIRWLLRAPLAAGAKGFARFQTVLR